MPYGSVADVFEKIVFHCCVFCDWKKMAAAHLVQPHLALLGRSTPSMALTAAGSGEPRHVQGLLPALCVYYAGSSRSPRFFSDLLFVVVGA